MEIYIDESGTFSGFHSGAISVVGALCIPSGCLAKIEKKYARVRSSLPTRNGEVKGKDLTESQVQKVVELLARNQAVFELTATDVGAHTKEGLSSFRDGVVDHFQAMVPKFANEAQAELLGTIDQLQKTSLPLFLQTMVTLDVLENVISHIPLYFSQRQPKELDKFSWIVDAKDPSSRTDWEAWWSSYCRGVLALRSKTRPAPRLKGADDTYLAKFREPRTDNTSALDLKLLMAEIRFSASPEFGLELVDIITNATRRALRGNLGHDGWKDIRRLMIHRRKPYISLMTVGVEGYELRDSTSIKVVNHFSNGGKNMVSPHFTKIAALEE